VTNSASELTTLAKVTRGFRLMAPGCGPPPGPSIGE
jgi:hypothetical protein